MAHKLRRVNGYIEKMYQNIESAGEESAELHLAKPIEGPIIEPIQESEVVEESLSIQDKEIDLIRRALAKHNGKRKSMLFEETFLGLPLQEYDFIKMIF